VAAPCGHSLSSGTGDIVTVETGKGHTTVANLWAGVLTVAIGALALFWLIPGFVTGANDYSRGLTPGFMPRVAACCMILFGASLAFASLRAILGGRAAVQEVSEENEELSFRRTEFLNTIMIALVSAVFIGSFIFLGFVVPSSLLLAFLIYATGYRKKSVLLSIAVVFPVTLELVLWHALRVQLPQFPLIDF
jgi:hypothetical protein